MLSKQALNNVLDIAKLGPVFTLEISQLHHLVTLMNTEIILTLIIRLTMKLVQYTVVMAASKIEIIGTL